MTKRLTLLALTITGFAGLGVGVWQARRHWEWLETRGLDGPVFLGLSFLGILMLIMPFHLRQMWDRVTPLGMVREFVVRGGLMMGVVTAVLLIFALIAFVISIPARWGPPYLLIPGLLLLLPLLLSGIDLAKGTVRRTGQNLVWGWTLYAFQTTYLLLVQFATIPIAFVLYPAGFFLQLMSLIDGAVRLFSRTMPDSLPLLCNWFKVGEAACGPTLISFHVGHLLLAILGLKFGEKLLDKAADWYATGMEWLAGRIEK
jgi:hypothetical protein